MSRVLTLVFCSVSVRDGRPEGPAWGVTGPTC